MPASYEDSPRQGTKTRNTSLTWFLKTGGRRQVIASGRAEPPRSCPQYKKRRGDNSTAFKGALKGIATRPGKLLEGRAASRAPHHRGSGTLPGEQESDKGNENDAPAPLPIGNLQSIFLSRRRLPTLCLFEFAFCHCFKL
jgi:hypothetical protein